MAYTKRLAKSTDPTDPQDPKSGTLTPSQRTLINTQLVGDRIMTSNATRRLSIRDKMVMQRAKDSAYIVNNPFTNANPSRKGVITKKQPSTFGRSREGSVVITNDASDKQFRYKL